MENLPEYKQEYFKKRDAEIAEKEKNFKQNEMNRLNASGAMGSLTQTAGLFSKAVKENDIWSSGQYSDEFWKKSQYTSFYADKHNEEFEKRIKLKKLKIYFPREFKKNVAVNPEVARKDNNMRKTRISEYSNAMHNNRVFINPSFSSC